MLTIVSEIILAYDYYSPLDLLENDANLESEIDGSLENVTNLLDDERGVHLFHTTRDSLLRLLRASKFSMFKVVTPQFQVLGVSAWLLQTSRLRYW